MRKASLSRKTNETDISVSWNLDGTGKSSISTGIPFIDHMLDLFCRHGYFDLNISLKGDIEIDHHHSVEDLGIVMGQVFKEAVGDKKGINRYGNRLLPMDESLAQVALDISNRPHLSYKVPLQHPLETFDSSLIKEFFAAFVQQAGVTLHITLLAGDNAHHCLEAVFKGVAKALDQALQLDGREADVPSTKGML
jgi:imidazoleglycerol-phosphate dehydratase